MKILIQRVLEANVQIESQIHSKIDTGLLIYICFEQNDSILLASKVVDKIVSLRLFADTNGKMNLNVNQMNQEVLIISQFTLSWSGDKGNRPSFERSMNPSDAKNFYDTFLQELDSKLNTQLQSGIFLADMKVSSTNDGPVTFFLSF